MNRVHAGVLLPVELHNATDGQKDAYATQVKLGNRAFVNAVFMVEDAAERLGVDLDGCPRCGLYVPCERHAEA